MKLKLRRELSTIYAGGKRIVVYDNGDVEEEDLGKEAPAEPLIKDEKIRKAVRAWAEACDFTRIYFDEYHNAFRNINDVGFTTISFLKDADEQILPLEDGKTYTIAELCGEEEE